MCCTLLASADELNKTPQQRQEARKERIEDLSPERRDRIQRRQVRQAAFARHIDSLIVSHDFTFIPNTYNVEPTGAIHQVMNPAFRIGIFPAYADIYMPYLQGNMPPYQPLILNTIITQLNGYSAVQGQNNWTITFSSWLYSPNHYTFTFTVYPDTGETILDIASDFYNTVTYNGTITGNY